MCSAESLQDATPQIPKSPKSETISRNPNRRSNKPIMEKRRRARINNCLNELKGILLEAMRKDPARHSKLEKADILELTVSHLKSLHNAPPPTPPLASGSKFMAGYAECMAEVRRFLASPPGSGFDNGTSSRLLAHLEMVSPSNLDSPPQQPREGFPTPFSNSPVISLVPSRLSTGEIAFVVPGFRSFCEMENLPIELSCSNANIGLIKSDNHSSVSSSSSSLSPSLHLYSYVPQPFLSPSSQPLSLVTKREGRGPEGSCWRPW